MLKVGDRVITTTNNGVLDGLSGVVKRVYNSHETGIILDKYEGQMRGVPALFANTELRKVES